MDNGVQLSEILGEMKLAFRLAGLKSVLEVVKEKLLATGAILSSSRKESMRSTEQYRSSLGFIGVPLL